MTAPSLLVVIGGRGRGGMMFGGFCLVGFFKIRFMPLSPTLQ